MAEAVAGSGRSTGPEAKTSLEEGCAKQPLSTSSLPQHLKERARVGKAAQVTTSTPTGQFVLYVMRKVLRGHENAALDVAVESANALGLPLVVLLHVEDRYAHATARRQTFILQGVAAARQELGARFGPTERAQVAVHVSRRGNRQQAALSLAHRAALIVVEEPFCSPWLAGVHTLCSARFTAPVWLVDADSLVPCGLVRPSSTHRAYQYEKATQAAAATRLAFPWVDVVLRGGGEGSAPASAEEESSPPSVPAIALPFKPVGDLSAGSIAALVAEMDGVDHSVPPVLHTQGGSEHGYRRWQSFVARGGLESYARRRNDALDSSGVSRMSAYLNLGMVSPMRLGREVRARARSGAPKAHKGGVAKFMAEFETWRGVSYAFCYHHTPPGATGATLAMLPAWARETLARHAKDPRPRLVPVADLARGETGDAVWDALQASLVRTGELHNNARMGWGKAVLQWCTGPEEALAALIGLNDRFALDGHSPPSVGGVMGCFGLFEAPKAENQVYGKVQKKGLKRKYMALVNAVK